MVRRPGDDDLVGGHLAAGVLRRLHGLPGGRRRRRLPRRPARPRGRPQARRRTTPTSAARPTRSRPDPEDVPDVDAAATIFDSISYAKGNSVLRQLVTWLGDETFLRGVNTYLTRHRFGNATLADFVAALDEASDRDVRAWVELGCARTGFDTLRVERDGDGPGAAPRRRRGRTGSGSRRTTTPGRGRQRARRRRRRAGPAARRSPAGSWCRTATARPSRGWCSTTGRGRPSTAGLARIDDDVTRAVLWTMLFDRVQTPRRSTPTAFVDLVERHLPGERSATLVTAVLDAHPQPGAAAARRRRVVAGRRSARSPRACGTGLAARRDPRTWRRPSRPASRPRRPTPTLLAAGSRPARSAACP